jgi:hypothetical protein
MSQGYLPNRGCPSHAPRVVSTRHLTSANDIGSRDGSGWKKRRCLR